MNPAIQDKPLKVLALCAFPTEAAATRFRVAQFTEPLRRRNIEITLSPFLNSEQFRRLYTEGGLLKKALAMVPAILKRISGIVSAPRYDVILIQREAMIFGPAIFEYLYSRVGRAPIALDLDDPTYVRYVSPTYGRLASFIKFFGKTDKLIRQAKAVLAGNRFIAEYARSSGAIAEIIPTVVDANLFKPVERLNDPLVIGWIGTHSTFPFLEKLFPVLSELASKHDFVLKIVGGRPGIKIDGVDVYNQEWDLVREVTDFQSLDIGLYPISEDGAANLDWLKGKSGFKAIQYMSVGVPFVMSPLGVCAEIGVNGETHFNASLSEDWYNSLDALLGDASLRKRMGTAAREYFLRNYGLEQQADKLADILTTVARG